MVSRLSSSHAYRLMSRPVSHVNRLTSEFFEDNQILLVEGHAELEDIVPLSVCGEVLRRYRGTAI